MIRKLVATDENTATVILRLVLGVVLFRARRAENAGLVRRLGFFRHHGLLYRHNAHPCSARLPGDCGGVFRWARPHSGTRHPNRSVRNRLSSRRIKRSSSRRGPTLNSFSARPSRTSTISSSAPTRFTPRLPRCAMHKRTLQRCGRGSFKKGACKHTRSGLAHQPWALRLESAPDLVTM